MRKFKGVPYGISFDTQEVPGKVEAVVVALDKIYMGPTDKARVDLCDHPLYHHLEKYVKANPSKETLSGKS